MNFLSDALAIERNRLFVGRESELRYIQSWLTQHDSPTEVLFITGIGGVGKSALILQFLNTAKNENISSIWLDGRACTDTPAGFLEMLHHSMRNASSNISMQDIVTAISQNKTLICIDNYEYIHKIEGWLREVFLPQFSATGLLVVMSSRKNLAFQWQNDIAWQGRVRQIELFPLSRREALSFCNQRGLDNMKEFEKLISDTKGLPLALALFIESLQSGKWGSDTTWRISMRISAELMREVAAFDLQETLDLLCILPEATPELLGRLSGNPLSTNNLHSLSQISFIRPTTGGFALHDVARTQLIKDFLHRDPKRYQALRLKIIEELAKELKEARGQQKKRMASLLLSVCRDVFQIHSISVISTDPDFLQMDSFRNTDLPHMHQIITEQAEYFISSEADHKLLDPLAEQFPESIHVFRSADSIPLAFNIGVLLYRETITFLEPFIPGVIEACFLQESKLMRQMHLEEADTYFKLLTGVTSRETEYSFYELAGCIVADFIMHKSADLRVVIVTAYEDTNELLWNVGFQTRPLPGLPKEHPLYGASIHELDMRDSEFGEHILAMIRASSGNRERGEALTGKDFRTALPLVGNPSALGQSELARKLGCSGSDLQQMLQSILYQDPPFPLDRREQELLQLYCSMPFLTSDLAAERLNISRATYFRVRKQAIRNLNEILIRSSIVT